MKIARLIASVAILLSISSGATTQKQQIERRYFGLSAGHIRATVRIDSATLTESTAVVWAGVNAPRNRTWVQGGVLLDSETSKPAAYTEVKYYDNDSDDPDIALSIWPMHRWGESVKVTLLHAQMFWRTKISWGDETRISPRVRVSSPSKIAVMELIANHNGRARVIAHIDRRQIVGHI
jgi:hypothetical protein